MIWPFNKKKEIDYRVLSLKPYDVLVLRVTHEGAVPTQETIDSLGDQLEEQLGFRPTILFLSDVADIQVLRGDE